MPLTVSQNHRYELRELLSDLTSEVDDHNEIVTKFNDAVFEAREDVEQSIIDINHIVEKLQALGDRVYLSLTRQAEDQALAADEEPWCSILAGWRQLSLMDTFEEPDGLELDGIYFRGPKNPLPTLLFGSPTEAERLLAQRIEVLQAELVELRKMREVKP